MKSIMRDIIEKIMKMEIKLKQCEEESKKKDKEMDMVWKALLGFKKLVEEKENEVESLRNKVEKLEEEKKKEVEEIWKELEIWNNEWIEMVRNMEEKEEKEKWKNFNEKRDEERRETTRIYTRESIRTLWIVIRRYEEDLGLAKTEAREMMTDLLGRVERLSNKDNQKEEKVKEKNEAKNRWRKSRLALTWPVEEDEENKESE